MATGDQLKAFKLIEADHGLTLHRDGVQIAATPDLTSAAHLVADLVGSPIWFVPDQATIDGAEPFTYEATIGRAA